MTRPGTVLPLLFLTVFTAIGGALRAPFTGIHGWYLNNQSTEDVVVRLKVAGHYTD